MSPEDSWTWLSHNKTDIHSLFLHTWVENLRPESLRPWAKFQIQLQVSNVSVAFITVVMTLGVSGEIQGQTEAHYELSKNYLLLNNSGVKQIHEAEQWDKDYSKRIRRATFLFIKCLQSVCIYIFTKTLFDHIYFLIDYISHFIFPLIFSRSFRN